MSTDLFTLKALADELNSQLKDAKTDKITQPEQDEVRFFLRFETKKSLCLVMSCNPQAPHVNLSFGKKQNPALAPSFLMVLRKHLLGARINSVEIFNEDRTLRFAFTGRNEMQDVAHFNVYVELMNHNSNIILADGNDMILDAVKKQTLDSANAHLIVRGLKYEPVKQPKRCVFSAQIEEFEDNGKCVGEQLSMFSGFSKETANELLFRAGLSYDSHADGSNSRKILSQVEKFKNIYSSTDFSPCVYSSSVYPFPYFSLSAEEDSFKNYGSMSDAFDALYGEIDCAVRLRAKIKNLSTALKHFKARAEKYTALNREKLAECENMDSYRISGELIVSNIYKIKRGDKSVSVLNYYTNEETEIKLDEKLSPSQNSAAYYAKYNKLKRTKEFLEKKAQEDAKLLDYVSSIEDSLSHADLNDNLEGIEKELETLGAIKPDKHEKKKNSKTVSQPLKYEYNGFTVMKGKNNIENDELTFKTASLNDLWFHIKNEHGAHCILFSNGNPPTDEAIRFAAEIAASNATAKVAVDYTLRKHVKRMPGGFPGQVVYTDFKSVTVEPDAHKEFLIKK